MVTVCRDESHVSDLMNLPIDTKGFYFAFIAQHNASSKEEYLILCAIK